MITLERITTVYIEGEDRIRLSGEVATGEVVVIWLTQRLLQRLLPLLLQLLQGRPADVLHAEVLQGFAQQAAKADLQPQVPVQIRTGSTAWVAQSVDMTATDQAVILTFRGADSQAAALTLAAIPLRQWLGILHDMYGKAEWPLAVWPGWIRESALPVMDRPVVVH